MRSDIVPGAKFPDYELTDHTRKRRKLSELQGNDPMILIFSRGHYCPKDHQQHLELAPFYPKIAVAYTQIVTISTDNHARNQRVPRRGRRPVDISLGFGAQGAEGSRHPGIHRPAPQPDDPAYARAGAGPRHPQNLQRLLVLGPPLHRRSLAGSARGHRRRAAPTGISPRRACARTTTRATRRSTGRMSPARRTPPTSPA